MADSHVDMEALSLEELKRLVRELFEVMSRLREENAALREEVARLRGLKGRPKLKPSGMNKQAKTRQKAAQDGKQGKRGRGAKQLVIDEDRVITIPHPEGSRFRGYEDFVVQDLVVKQLVVRYRRERWETPDGQRLVAPLPSGLRGHFGPELRRFVLAT